MVVITIKADSHELHLMQTVAVQNMRDFSKLHYCILPPQKQLVWIILKPRSDLCKMQYRHLLVFCGRNHAKQKSGIKPLPKLHNWFSAIMTGGLTSGTQSPQSWRYEPVSRVPRGLQYFRDRLTQCTRKGLWGLLNKTCFGLGSKSNRNLKIERFSADANNNNNNNHR